MDEYTKIMLEIFDEPKQCVAIRQATTIHQLIAEILHQYADLEQRPSAYDMFLQNRGTPLRRNLTLHQQHIVEGDHLVLGWAGMAPVLGRHVITGRNQAILREVQSGVSFHLPWQPAIIGRISADPEHNKLLAVNLENFSNGQRVSRRHAQITEQNGRFYIESLNAQNSTMLNEDTVPLQQKQCLNDGDIIYLPNSDISMIIIIDQEGE